MNKNLPIYIAGASLVVALACIGSAISSQGKAKKVANEAYELREQIVRMQAFVPDISTQTYAYAESIDTNDAVQLRALLAQKDQQIESLQSQEKDAEGEPKERSRQPRESFEDRIAKMKAEDPEGYAEMVKRRDEFQQKMRYNLAERTATFMDLDTSGMSEDDRANHDLLVAKMANVWELTEKFQDPEAAPDREAIRELFNEMREVRPLMEQERTIMFKQLGSDLGYEGEDSEAFAAHVEEIISTTSLQMPSGGGRGDSGGGRGGGK